jgi:hypothetical protein
MTKLVSALSSSASEYASPEVIMVINKGNSDKLQNTDYYNLKFEYCCGSYGIRQLLES